MEPVYQQDGVIAASLLSFYGRLLSSIDSIHRSSNVDCYSPYGNYRSPLVIVFPLGLFMTSVGFDALALLTRDAHWLATSYNIMVAGLIGGVVAVIAGYIDYCAIPSGTRAKRIGWLHGLGSILVMLVFAASVVARMADPLALRILPFALSVTGAILAGLAGWLGGELVTRMGIGVADDAHVDAEGTNVLGPQRHTVGQERPEKVAKLL